MSVKQSDDGFGPREALIFSVGYIRERKESIIGKNELSHVLGLTRQTVNRRLNGLKKEGLFIPEKHGICGYLLSKDGRAEYGKLYVRVMNTNLSTGLHGCEGRVDAALASIKDPVHVIKVILAAMNHLELDVVELHMIEQSMRVDSKERIILRELEDSEGSLDIAFNSLAEEYTLIGKKPEDLPDRDSIKSILDATIAADVLKRRLFFPEAYRIFSEIVRRKSGPNAPYRIFSIVGMIYCTKAMKGNDTALKMAEDFLGTLDHPEYRVMLMKCKGDINIYKDMDEAILIYNSCLKSLNTLKLHSLRCGIFNNLGVVYFKKNDLERANDYWKEVLSIATEKDYVWIEAVTKLNIADYLALSGKIERAKRLLGEARKFFLSVDDREGLSGYHFNRALVAIEEGDKDKAIEHFFKCEEFPLIYKDHLMDRRNVINDRFRSKSWEILFP